MSATDKALRGMSAEKLLAIVRGTNPLLPIGNTPPSRASNEIARRLRQQESEGRRCSECKQEVQILLCGHCHCCGDPRCKSCISENEGVEVEIDTSVRGPIDHPIINVHLPAGAHAADWIGSKARLTRIQDEP